MLGGWLIYPTLTEDFKESVGIPVTKDPTVEAAQELNIQFEVKEIGAIPTLKK